MQKRIKSMLQFIAMGKSGITSAPSSLPASESTMAGKLYGSISSLTLDRFIKCVCDGDLSALFINEKDFIVSEYLTGVWNEIHEAFMDGVRDKEGLYKIRLIGKINHLQFNYDLIQLCIKFLAVACDREVVDMLQSLVRVGDFNTEDMVSYRNDLQVVLTRAQQLLFQVEEKKAELAVIQKNDKPGEKTTRKQFDQLIASVAIYTKFHIDKKNISVSEFIEYYISRRENFEALEAQYAKSNR